MRSGGCGTVFKVDASGNYSVVYRFLAGKDGGLPYSSLVEDEAGNLYGNTLGVGNLADSTVFKIDPQGNETVLYDFNGPQGCCQDSPLALDTKGNIYGTSPYGGGRQFCQVVPDGCGSIYQLTPAGKIKVLHVFEGTDGIQPEGGLVVGANGLLYGTTVIGGNLSCYGPDIFSNVNGGVHGCGTVFSLNPKTKQLTTLHVFTGQADGSVPYGLTPDNKGNLYGIAFFGGNTVCDEDPYGCGIIYKIDSNGNFSVLYAFTPDIKQPDFQGRTFFDAQGNFYGVNGIGGSHNSGFIFKLGTDGTFSYVFDFPSTADVPDGSFVRGVVMDSAGNFYGSMLLHGDVLGNCETAGQQQGCGTVFEVSF